MGIWANTLMAASIVGFFTLPLQDWLLRCLRFERQRGGEDRWPERFAITIWMLWIWRNDHVFDKGTLAFHKRLEMIRRRVEENRYVWM